MPGDDAMHPAEELPVTAVRNTPHTVEFSGVQGLTLVADEWLVSGAAPTQPPVGRGS